MQRHGTGCQTSPDLPHHGNMASGYYSTTIESNFFQFFFFFFWTNLFHVHHITLILKPPSIYKLQMIKQAMFASINHLERSGAQAGLLFVDFFLLLIFCSHLCMRTNFYMNLNLILSQLYPKSSTLPLVTPQMCIFSPLF